MKKNNKNLILLNMLFAAALVCANCIAAKQLPVGKWFGEPIAITAGILCYPLTFLITDIISEIWGKKEANTTVKFGFVSQIIAIILITIANLLPGNDPATSSAFNSILGSNWILVIGSLLACIMSQTFDVFLFHKIRDRQIAKHHNTKAKWVRNNVATILSQLIDSVVFYIGLIIMLRTNGIILPLHTCVITILSYWIIKTIIALCDTPFFYLLTRNSDKQ